MTDWKEMLAELARLIEARSAAADEEEARRLGREIERVSEELRRLWQMTDEQIGNALRDGMANS